MAGYFKISNSIAQQVNFDDIGLVCGWNPDNEPTSQEVICQYINDFIVNRLLIPACELQESLQGKLNYDKEEKIEAFKATTVVEWVEDEA